MAGSSQPGAAGQTLYRRPLPSTCVAFSSAEGRALFARALARGSAEPYFALAEQFTTQAEPAYCGLATLVMCMNAMAIDPGRLWKGVWRWFAEDMLSCCKDLEVVKREGISLCEFAKLARCNGANCRVVRGGERCDLESFRAQIIWSTGPESKDGADFCCSFLVVNYDRSTFGQTGTGHFSPVAAYDAESDRALILDVARFKYPPHWVKVEALHRAIGPPRGFAVLTPGQVRGGGGPALGCSECLLEGFDQCGCPCMSE